MDVVNQMSAVRPNTKHVFHLVSNVVFFIYRLDYLLGHPDQLPDFIKNKRCIIALVTGPEGSDLYQDRKCLLRCLAAYFKRRDTGPDDRPKVERQTDELLGRWCRYKNITVAEFAGVNIADMADIEQCFRVNINLYQLLDENEAVQLRVSSESFQDTVYCNVFQNHVSLITDFKTYAKQWKCQACNKFFRRPYHLKAHGRACEKIGRIRLPGGYWNRKPSIFEQLRRFSIPVDDGCFYRMFACYDFESLLLPLNNNKMGEATTGISVCLPQCQHAVNEAGCTHCLPLMEACCFVNADEGELLDDFLKRAGEIQSAAERYYRHKLAKTFTALEEKIHEIKICLGGEKLLNINNDPEVSRENAQEEAEEDQEEEIFEDIDDDDDDDDDDGDGDGDDDEDEGTSNNVLKLTLKIYVDLLRQLNEYVRQLPLLGFNSSRYDLNLIKSKLLPKLGIHKVKSPFVVKKGNTYACITAEKFKLLDVSNYLAAGYSYDCFLKAYKVPLGKSFFPYEWFDDEEKLNHPSLPPADSFYSSLKNKNTLGDTAEEITENYGKLQQLWREQNMSTFKQFLMHYNICDVTPFVLAVNKMMSFYTERNIDLFKTSISAPGVARQLLHESSNNRQAYFSLLDQNQEDIYKIFKLNLSGGPSIIFKRHLEVGVTPIRGNKDKMPKKVIGEDCASLYLYCIGLEQPTGRIIRRRAENHFQMETRDKYTSAIDYLDWVATKRNLVIQHKMNDKEFRIGPYFVDGYCSRTATVFEFNGK